MEIVELTRWQYHCVTDTVDLISEICAFFKL